MALSIKDDETDALVRRLATVRNLSYTAAIRLAVSNELQRAVAEPVTPAARLEMLERINERVDRLPVLDHRNLDDLLGYDESGLPA